MQSSQQEAHANKQGCLIHFSTDEVTDDTYS